MANYEHILQQELEKCIFLSGLTARPEIFLYALNELVYNHAARSLYETDSVVNSAGLPAATEDFYTHQASSAPLPTITQRTPRILNIASGSEESRKLPAINIDISLTGKPDVVADAQKLPFKKGAFTVVRASHVLEHIPQTEIETTLGEWKRVMHEFGELHIAVPDAEVVFAEIQVGQTPKGQPALSLTESTAPLAQIFGLGYENPQTDHRWLHTILFSEALLEHFLRLVKLYRVTRCDREEDLAAYSGVDDDSQNHYSLHMSAEHERFPHIVDDPLPERSFREKCTHFLSKHEVVPPVTYVIPVQDEAKNLRHFLASLEHAENQLGVEREFVFVVNGSSDASAKIITEYIPESFLTMRLIYSDSGIVKAFRAGIAARTSQGFIGKLDADCILHPHALDLMHMHLVEQPQLQATYAEPIPLDSQFVYNAAEHNPILRSKRLYIHGRASLYRDNPFAQLEDQSLLDVIQVEDMFLSFYFAYFWGLDAVSRAPSALIYSKTIKSVDDVVKQVARSSSEMKRIFEIFPPFKALEKLLEREVYPSYYKDILDKAREESAGQQATEWTRLPNTK